MSAGRREFQSTRATTLTLAILAMVVPLSVARPAPAAAAAGGLLRLLGQSPAIEPGGDFVIRVQATSPPAGTSIRVTVYSRTLTRSAFQQTLDGRTLPRPFAPPVVLPAAADASGTINITIHTAGSDPPLVAMGPSAEGVFPVRIELTDADGRTLDQLSTYLIRLPVTSDGPALNVALIVPMGGAPQLRPDGSVAVDDTVRAGFVERGAVLQSRADVPVTIDATPESVASLARAGDPAAEQALRRAGPSRQVVASPFVAVDAPGWIDAGLSDELARQYARGTAVLARAGAVPSVSTQIARSPLDAATLRWLRASGALNVVVPDAGLSALDPRRFPATLTQPFHLNGVEDVGVAVADAGLAKHLVDQSDPIVGANHLLADLAILYFDQPTSARVAIADLPATVAPAALDALLGGLGSIRILKATTLDSAFRSVPLAGARGEPDGGSDPLMRTTDLRVSPLSTFARELRASEARLASYRTAVDSAERLASLEERMLVAGALSLSPGAQSSYLNGVDRSMEDDLRHVVVPGRQVITFTARDGVVSVLLRNEAPYTVRATVHLEGTKLQIRDHPNGAVPVTLAPGSTRVSVGVHTLTSGDSPLDVTVTTPDGLIEIGRTRIIVRSTAFSGVGVVLSVGAGFFLLVWWGRHVLLTRRAGRTAGRHKHPTGV